MFSILSTLSRNLRIVTASARAGCAAEYVAKMSREFSNFADLRPASKRHGEHGCKRIGDWLSKFQGRMAPRGERHSPRAEKLLEFKDFPGIAAVPARRMEAGGGGDSLPASAAPGGVAKMSRCCAEDRTVTGWGIAACPGLG
jgi:hypothetical protein